MESVYSTTTTVEDQHVATHPHAAANPPLSAATASLWHFNIVLALPVPNHHHQEISRSEDHPTAPLSLFPCAPTIGKDHLPTKNHRRDLGNVAELIDAGSSLSLSLPMYRKTQISIHPLPNKPIINNHHPCNLKGNFFASAELIDAASSLSLSLPTKRKRLIIIGPTPKKPQPEEGVIAKKQKVMDKTPPTFHHHHHWIHKRLSTSDINLSARLLLPKEEIIKYVLPLMDIENCRACQNKDGLRVKIWDLDSESEHQLSLKQWKTGSFLLTSNWNTEFVKRRSLQQGDTISMCWDFQNLRFLFRKFNAQSY